MPNRYNFVPTRLVGGQCVVYTPVQEYEYYYTPRRALYTHCLQVPALCHQPNYHLQQHGYQPLNCPHMASTTYNCFGLTHEPNNMEHELVWPRGVDYTTETTYQYYKPSRVRYLLPCITVRDSYMDETPMQEENAKYTTSEKKPGSSNVYRAEEGYLVEEPNDSDTEESSSK